MADYFLSRNQDCLVLARCSHSVTQTFGAAGAYGFLACVLWVASCVANTKASAIPTNWHLGLTIAAQMALSVSIIVLIAALLAWLEMRRGGWIFDSQRRHVALGNRVKCQFHELQSVEMAQSTDSESGHEILLLRWQGRPLKIAACDFGESKGREMQQLAQEIGDFLNVSVSFRKK